MSDIQADTDPPTAAAYLEDIAALVQAGDLEGALALCQTALGHRRHNERLWQAKLNILRKPESIYDYRFEDFELVGYDPHPHIAGAVAV